MALNLQEKKKIVLKIHKIANIALSAVIADSRGIKANQITELRKDARKIGVKISIVQNTLLNLAIKKTNFECLQKFLTGPSFIGYSLDHPGSAIRLFKDFSKKNIKFKITNAVFEKKILTDAQIDQLANMPTYKESIMHLLFIIKESAAGKMIRVLSNLSDKKNNLKSF
ncbi:50S ribosomal protein L10 [Buchnera aphidicola (Eriosoma grossulariae)]|uniref:50S ribosomal protein L10 n=1 Tax=Buchnera aphidicola TaxID=9 RepID=UPI003464C2B6